MEHHDLTLNEAIAYKACQDCNLAHNSWVNYPETPGNNGLGNCSNSFKPKTGCTD